MANTYCRTIIISVISCPAEIKGQTNNEMINFLQAYDAETGIKIDCPFSISKKRADAFSLRKLIVTDANGNAIHGKIELNGLNARPLVVEADIRDVQEGEIYGTNADGEPLRYRATTSIIESVKTLYDYDAFMAKRQEGKTAVNMATSQCKTEFGSDWSVATSTPEQLAVYRMYLEIFSKM